MFDFEKLVDRIKSRDAYDLAFSNEKFVHDKELHELGLHVFRSIKSRRKTPPINKDGYRLYSGFSDLKQAQDFAYAEIAQEYGLNPDDFVLKNKPIVHDTTNVQYNAHVDTFHPAIKMWIYKHDVTSNHGPLHYLPGSHLLSREKLLWLHQCGKFVIDNGLDKRHPDYDDGSFRLKTPYTNQPYVTMEGPAFSIVVADVCGVHHRGLAKPGVLRDTLYIYVKRDTPFFSSKEENLSWEEEQSVWNAL